MTNTYPEMTDKFGIWRVHQHFDLKEGEVFHETSNPHTRESVLKIIKQSELPQNAYATTWKLTSNGPIVAEWCCDDSPVTRTR